MTSEDAAIPQWVEVRPDQQVERLYDLVREFHDAIVVKAEWFGRDIVDDKYCLLFGGRGTLVLGIQSQFRDVPPIELLFRDVKSLTYKYDMDAPPQIDFRQDGVSVKLLAWTVDCAALSYRRWLISATDLELQTFFPGPESGA